MAYNQTYEPPQRPYNGRAAQRPGPPQGYNQAPPPPQQQQYPPQQYDQYAQDGYGYDDYNNGYAQDYNGGYQDTNGGGRGNGYPPQDQGYPPQQQEVYPDPRATAIPPRGDSRQGPPPPVRQRPPMDDGMRGGYDPRGGPQGRGAPPPRQRPPMDDGMRGGYDPRGGAHGRGAPTPQRALLENNMRGGDPRSGQGGYANGGAVGRGGRPGPPDRGFSSDPNQQHGVRKPLKTPPMSPDQSTWDNPFPTFPGQKKKTSVDEERNILQKLENMNVSESPSSRPRTAGSKKGQDHFGPPSRAATFDDYGRPSLDSQRRPVPPEDYGRASGEVARGPPQRSYTQQDAYANPGRQGPAAGYGGAPRQDGYGDAGYGGQENFGPPSRSMTMPSEQQAPPRVMNGVGPSAPYNGPVGRNMPPRPATATGTRPPPQRAYQAPVPAPQPYVDPYANDQGQTYNHRAVESISEFYDSYYDDPDPVARNSGASEMPNFDAMAPQRRGGSVDGHIGHGAPLPQPIGYQKPIQNQADYRAQAQPQAAVFDSTSDGQRTPTHANFQHNQYDEYGGHNGQYQQSPANQRQPPQGAYDNQPRQNGFQAPPRSTSAAPRVGQGYGPPPTVGPKPGMSGLPSGPANGPLPPNGGMPRNNSAGSGSSAAKPKLSEDALPTHPVPVRPGLMQGSVAQQAINNKPTPVRNYNNAPPAATPAQSPPVQQQQQQQQVPNGPQPITVGELEILRNQAKASPNDTALQMLLIKKLVEASEVLVNTFPDVRMRNKMREKYVMDASKSLKRMVAAGNTDAMFYLADCYGRGALGLESNDKEAFSLYQSAAKAGHAAAAYRTAVCCELGNEEGGGTRKDPMKATQWYKRAATLGDTPAMYKMGMILLKGLLGQAKNPREAVGWLKRAAERADAENPHALHELGLLFEAPQTADGSVVRDEAYSLTLFKQAGELGYKFSQFRLGCAFEYGLLGCPIDPRQSIAWYSRAAVQEEHQSELALSGWYLTGSEGVLQQSDTEAYLWARKAAMAGLAKAEYAMGYFTEVGIGSPSSLEDAKRWYWRAAAQNFPKARERLEELKRNGGKGGMKSRERISRSKVGKQNEGECAVM